MENKKEEENDDYLRNNGSVVVGRKFGLGNDECESRNL